MLVRPHTLAILAFALHALGGSRPAEAQTPIRVVVQNETYSSLLISIVDESGRERRLGQAPPDFSNTLLLNGLAPDGLVRFVARQVGDEKVLYRSEPMRLSEGARVRWRLPSNTVGG